MPLTIMTPFLAGKIRSFLRLFRSKSKPIPPPPQQELQDIYIPPPPQQELQDIFIPPLLNLPLDILFEIFSLLPLPSQRIREAFQPLIIDDRSSLLHQCSIPSIPEVSVDLMIVVALNDRKRLEALTRYRVRMSSYQPRPRGVIPWFSGPHDATERIYLCPHIDLLPFVRDSYYWPQIECRSCETSVCVDSSEEEGLHVVLLSVRNLGEPHYYEGLHLSWEKIARENSHDITGAMIADMANVYGTSPLWGQVYSAWNRRRLLEPQVSRNIE
ncbi:hypothetical protein BDV33DRAFT_200781 [Aspergillus novoparasiticus]|uniref:F-box domain-containing protein n=1 Tax=Aspergillus novoparasiticus TaxID=986946 RepID=A0A5N6F1Y6_9EURO|nr:hypothetical protein BDV33DRAFT_200781 [Aspergillus novoparasiticus]